MGESRRPWGSYILPVLCIPVLIFVAWPSTSLEPRRLVPFDNPGQTSTTASDALPAGSVSVAPSALTTPIDMPSPVPEEQTSIPASPPTVFDVLKPTPTDLQVAEAYAQTHNPSAYYNLLVDSPLPLPGWKPGRAKPIVCTTGEYYPGYFSIPAENIVESAPDKRRDWATVVPGRKETYLFKVEASYRKDLEEAYFGITRRRFGWATNRNLEMLAAGCIPFFCGIEKLPRTGTLHSLQLDFLRWVVASYPGVVAKCFPHKKALGFPIDQSKFNKTAYQIIAAKLLQHTKNYQTTTYHALYFLSATSLTELPKRVLVVWASHYTIMLTGFIHGLTSLGVVVEDVPRRPEIYRGPDCAEHQARTYAKGWFFFCRANESQNISRADIPNRIRAKEFDVIVVSVTDFLTYHIKNASVDIPYWDDITASYPKDRILIMNDADLIKPMQADKAHDLMWEKGLYFKRETHGCNEPIW
jgi:hypothetical protein